MRAVLVVLIGLILSFVGCINTHTMPVDYGAQSDPQAILDALNTPVASMKATDIKVGEFVAMQTTQDIALGESFSVVGVTGATVTDKAEDTDKVIYHGVLHQLDLNTDGTYSKVSREGQIVCASKSPCACGECSSTAAATASKSEAFMGTKEEPLVPAVERQTLVSQNAATPMKSAAAAMVASSLLVNPDSARAAAVAAAAGSASDLVSRSASALASASASGQAAIEQVKSMGYSSPDKLLQAAATSSASALPTYHGFVSWHTVEAAPANVSSLPSCLGIANCQINVYHVNFDEIYWDKPQGTKVHVEVQVSPDVPYLSRNLSTCQSLLVNVGTAGSNVLLKQCSSVYDFRFQQDP